jgi:hypothetical protein
MLKKGIDALKQDRVESKKRAEEMQAGRVFIKFNGEGDAKIVRFIDPLNDDNPVFGATHTFKDNGRWKTVLCEGESCQYCADSDAYGRVSKKFFFKVIERKPTDKQGNVYPDKVSVLRLGVNAVNDMWARAFPELADVEFAKEPEDFTTRNYQVKAVGQDFKSTHDLTPSKTETSLSAEDKKLIAESPVQNLLEFIQNFYSEDSDSSGGNEFPTTNASPTSTAPVGAAASPQLEEF